MTPHTRFTFFFFNDPAPTEISTLSLHDALPISEACETLAAAGELALPTVPAERARAEAAERELDRAWAAFALGRYGDARDRVHAADVQLAGISAPRLHGTALALAGSIEARIGEPARARAELDDALVAAAGANAPELDLNV